MILFILHLLSILLFFDGLHAYAEYFLFIYIFTLARLELAFFLLKSAKNYKFI